jgi:nicotinamide mononucleotide transporter
MKKFNNVFIIFCCLFISFLCGYFSNDILIGGTVLCTALLCSFFSSNAKSINYLFGIINNAFVGYVGLKNGLYGYFLFNIFLFIPLQIIGYLLWKKHKDNKGNVIIKEMNLKVSIIITLSCTIGSLLVAYLLNLIPTQKLAILDAFSVVLNLCAFILMMLRYRECWWLWLINNIVDLVIWIINVINQGSNSIMMLVVSIAYLLINVYGIIAWKKRANKTKN